MTHNAGPLPVIIREQNVGMTGISESLLGENMLAHIIALVFACQNPYSLQCFLIGFVWTKIVVANAHKSIPMMMTTIGTVVNLAMRAQNMSSTKWNVENDMKISQNPFLRNTT